MIYPDAVERAVWDISLFVAIIYQSMSLPFKIAFEVKDSEFMFWFENTIDVMFIFDMLLNFNTGYHEKSRLILSRRKIFTNYVENWFWVDLVSSWGWFGSVRGRFGVGLESIWSRFGLDLGSVWGRFGVDLGSVWH